PAPGGTSAPRRPAAPPPRPSASGLAEEPLEGGDHRRLHERGRVPDTGYRDQLALRECFDHAPRLRLGQHVAVASPHDQGGARHTRERGPERGPLRRADAHALADVLRIPLPDPAPVGPLPQPAERELALILRAAPRDDR